MKLIPTYSCNHNDVHCVTFRSSKLLVFSESCRRKRVSLFQTCPFSVAGVHQRRTRVKGVTAQYKTSKGYEIEEMCRTCAWSCGRSASRQPDSQGIRKNAYQSKGALTKKVQGRTYFFTSVQTLIWPNRHRLFRSLSEVNYRLRNMDDFEVR